jgi:hypothetical protein
MIRFYTFVKDKTQARHPSSATSYQPLFLRVFLRFFAAIFLARLSTLDASLLLPQKIDRLFTS